MTDISFAGVSTIITCAKTIEYYCTGIEITGYLLHSGNSDSTVRHQLSVWSCPYYTVHWYHHITEYSRWESYGAVQSQHTPSIVETNPSVMGDNYSRTWNYRQIYNEHL